MNKYFGLLFVALAFAACSCDDDNNDMDDVDLLTGTWKMTAMNTENAYDLNGDGTASRNIMDETDCYQNELIRFNADGSGKMTSNSYADIELDLVIGTTNEYEYSVDCVAETDTTPFTYTHSGNQVKLNVDGQVVTTTLSGNTLTYTVPSGMFFEVEDRENGTTTIMEDITFVYTKQ